MDNIIVDQTQTVHVALCSECEPYDLQIHVQNEFIVMQVFVYVCLCVCVVFLGEGRGITP